MSRVRQHIPYLILSALALVATSIWMQVFAATPSHQLTVAFLNIGQGDSIYIQSPTGVEVLIDGGPGSALLKELPKVMRVGDRSVDAIIATHPDADHISGFIDLLRRYAVGAYIAPGIPKNTLTATTLEEEVDDEHIPRHLARRGMWLTLGGGAFLEILYPDFDPSSLAPNKANEGGVVAKLIYASTTVLFTADVSSSVEAHLMALDGPQLASDILKVGHHGSRFSSSPSFIADVSPEVGVISVGKNSYGHPTAQTLATLARYNVKTLRTDEEGTIVFVSNGKEFVRSR